MKIKQISLLKYEKHNSHCSSYILHAKSICIMAVLKGLQLNNAAGSVFSQFDTFSADKLRFDLLQIFPGM